jgi:2-haloacid dehalogenase
MITRRLLVQSAAGLFLGAGAVCAAPRPNPFGVKALFFDVFGTLTDWRSGVARDARDLLSPLGYSLDWPAFADAWRAQYLPVTGEVRSRHQPYVKLDVLERRMLDKIIPHFGLERLSEDMRWDAILGADIAHDYKPNRDVYLAAADALNLAPAECMMVAAHDIDLTHGGASGAGLRTAFIPRPDEYGQGHGAEKLTGPVDIIAKTIPELADKLGA